MSRIVYKYIMAGLVDPMAIMDEPPWVIASIISFFTILIFS